MKTFYTYKCDYCGMCYDNEKECRKCENAHINPTTIISYRHNFNKKYPEYINVKMSDGKTLIYNIGLGEQSD